MADLRSYNREFTSEFISLYKSLPELWKIKCKAYSDRNKKNDAYETMMTKMREVEPTTTKDSVKRKINSLRSSYRKELKKVDASIRSGGATEDIYEPSLWYFHLLDFLKDQETPRQSMTNFDDTLSQDESNSMVAPPPPRPHSLESAHSSTVTSPPPRPHSQESTHSDNSFDPPSSRSTIQSTSPPDISSLPPRRMKKRAIQDDNKINEAISNVGNCISQWSRSQPRPLDRHDTYGQNVAHKLRNMSNEQRIYTEKLINDAIFEGELGNLTRHCSILIPRQRNVPLIVPGRNILQTRNKGGFQNQDLPFYSIPDAKNLQPNIGSNMSRNTTPQTVNLSDSFQNQNLIFNSGSDAANSNMSRNTTRQTLNMGQSFQNQDHMYSVPDPEDLLPRPERKNAAYGGEWRCR